MRCKLQAAGLIDAVRVDSAGTYGGHAGAPPDARAVEHAARRGYDLSDLRARAVTRSDFERFDLVLAMDSDNLETLEDRCPVDQRRKLGRLTDYCSRHASPDVPDPYDGGPDGFEHVLDLIEDACDGLLARLERQTPTR